MSQSDCNSGGVPVSPDLGVSMIRAHVCPATGVSGRSAGSSRDGLEGGETRGLISLMMPEVSLQRKLYRLKTVCEMLKTRMRKLRFDFDQWLLDRVLRCILKFWKKWFQMKKAVIEFAPETSPVHRVRRK